MKTIFVVDDSDTNLATAEEALENHYRVMTLPSADKMFAMFEKLIPALILLDIEMPIMNGFQTLEQLKTSPKKELVNIPVIFLTGTIDSTIKEKSAKLGAVDIISKPFDQSILLNTINKYI